MESYDVVILSDYNKGVLNNDWFKNIKSHNIIADPKKMIFHFILMLKLLLQT